MNFPEINFSGNETYIEMARVIFSQFLTDFEEADVQAIVYQTYKYFNPSVVRKIDDQLNFLELWHGKTSAFKDVALQVLPRLLTQALKNIHESSEAVILVATSGDTGKAALEAFANVPQTRIVVFYPKDGVSDTQVRQMVTQEGDNVGVFAVKGNFDDTQTAVKRILNDEEYLKSKPSIIFSSANSINWGRLMPQIVYYFSSYFAVAKTQGEKINFVVPTGNFGDILAGYYAKKLGLPIGKMICASNRNNVLTDFIQTGTYSTKERTFHKTCSPSMDILISSNLERLLFDVYDGDAAAVAALMNDLRLNGEFTIGQPQLAKIQETFTAGFATEKETREAIKDAYAQHHYLIDTHTAVAFSVYKKLLLTEAETKVRTKTIILSTASPYKFPKDVYQAIYDDDAAVADHDYAAALYEKTGVEVPSNLKDLMNRRAIHTTVVEMEKDGIKNALESFLESRPCGLDLKHCDRKRKMKIIVPATSANFGCGFDSVGVALDLYLEVEVLGVADKWEIVSGFNSEIPKDETNLIVKTALALVPDLLPHRMAITSNVPITRGLGSSSTAIVAGVLLADELAHLRLTRHEKLIFASKLEGHPDNVVPAVLGGLVVACFRNGRLDYAPLKAPNCSYVVFIPNYSLPTRVARGVLPKRLDYPEAVTASAIANVMVANLVNENLQIAGKMMEEDRFHERYRDELVPELGEVRRIAHEYGAYASVLSGAGPTILILAPKESVPGIKERLSARFDADILELRADARGARVELY